MFIQASDVYQKEQELKGLKIDTGGIGADFDDFKTIFSDRYLHQK